MREGKKTNFTMATTHTTFPNLFFSTADLLFFFLFLLILPHFCIEEIHLWCVCLCVNIALCMSVSRFNSITIITTPANNKLPFNIRHSPLAKAENIFRHEGSSEKMNSNYWTWQLVVVVGAVYASASYHPPASC